MRILVAVASRHGATREIAENIATAAGTAPTDAGVWSEVEVRDASLLTSVDGFAAVVVGSSVYMGHWLDPALHLPERAMVAALRGKDGDHRDWPSIRAWGRETGLSLAKAEVAGTAS